MVKRKRMEAVMFWPRCKWVLGLDSLDVGVKEARKGAGCVLVFFWFWCLPQVVFSMRLLSCQSKRKQTRGSFTSSFQLAGEGPVLQAFAYGWSNSLAGSLAVPQQDSEIDSFSSMVVTRKRVATWEGLEPQPSGVSWSFQ